jgi:UDP-glucose 4-epimerase
MGRLVVVTGGAGFVGTNLIRRLLAAGDRVISLDNYFSGSKDNHLEGAEYREGHTKDIERHIPETPDLVYHLGEYSRVEQSILEPEVVHDLNTEGTKGVIEFWKKRKMKLVYAGSSTKFAEEGFAKDTVPYVKTKAENTELVKKVGEAESLPYAITYFYNVYGPGERAGLYGTVIEAFRQMYVSGAPLAVTAPGTQVRNFTHVDDIIDGLLLVGEKGQGDEYGLGAGQSYSILEVAKMFGTETVMLPERAASRMSSKLDDAKSRGLGWTPSRTLVGYIEEFLATHTRGTSREKRVLVFSTTFYPIGPAEDALIELMRKMPDVTFDIITTKFSKEGMAYQSPVANAIVHRVGVGHQIDKFLLPFLGYGKALELRKKHSYLFAWSIMASYAALAALFLKNSARIPLLITLADQRLARLSFIHRVLFRSLLTQADQVYGMNASHEAHAASLAKRALSRGSLGEGDAFANQLRYAYAERLLAEQKEIQKKVLIFSLNYYPRFIGGAEVAIKEITDRIPNIEFHVLTLRFDSELPREEKIGNVLVHRIGFATPYPSIGDLGKYPLKLNKYWYQVAAAWKAAELHRKYRYDGIWAMMAHSCGIPAGVFKKKYPEVKYLLTLQEGDPPETIERLMRPVAGLFKQGFTRADALQPISTFLYAWGKRMGFGGHAEVIPNAVDTERFSKTFSLGELSEEKEMLGKKEEEIFLVTTSRLVHKNAVDDVIRALPLLPENVSFLIYGIGPDEEKLRTLAKEQGVESRARFMGEIGHGAMPRMLAACDIFIRPSRSEGMGNSFVEAMAAGLPVIATQEGGIADFLFDKKRNPDKETTGWAVDKDSPEQIATAVKDILAHPEEVKRVVATAKAMVKEKYNWDLIAKEMRALFGHLLGEG